jgi:hypothetical protein
VEVAEGGCWEGAPTGSSPPVLGESGVVALLTMVRIRQSRPAMVRTRQSRPGSGFRVQGSGFRVQGSGFRVQGSGFRVQGLGFRVQGSLCGSGLLLISLGGRDLGPCLLRDRLGILLFRRLLLGARLILRGLGLGLHLRGAARSCRNRSFLSQAASCHCAACDMHGAGCGVRTGQHPAQNALCETRIRGLWD